MPVIEAPVPDAVTGGWVVPTMRVMRLPNERVSSCAIPEAVIGEPIPPPHPGSNKADSAIEIKPSAH